MRIRPLVLGLPLVVGGWTATIARQPSDAPPVTTSCPSPTGYRPKMLATETWQCRMKRMTDENHPWLATLTGNADGERYANRGRWEALEYQRTGNEKYAALALSSWNPVALRNGNDLREFGIEMIALREILKPYLEKVGRLAEIDGILRQNVVNMGVGVVNPDGTTAVPATAGTRFVDSDALTSYYLTIANTDAALGTTYLSQHIRDGYGGAMKPVGGLTATGVNDATMRNAFGRMIAVLSADGFWAESTGYNQGTTSLVSMGCEFARQAYGKDICPEMTAWREARMRQMLHEITPNLKDSFQQGDVQEPNYLRNIDLSHWMPATHRPPTTQPDLQAAAQQFDDDVWAAHGWTLRPGGEPVYARFFYFADPYAARKPWAPFLASVYRTTGTAGVTYTRDAQVASATWFPNFNLGFVDHIQTIMWGDFSLWDTAQQRWALHHPIGYGIDDEYGNTTTIAGRKGLSFESGQNRAFGHRPGAATYTAGVSAGWGPDVRPNYYDPPPAYISESGRSVLHLHDGGEWVSLVFDRHHVNDPKTQIITNPNGTTRPALARYSTTVQTRMQAFPLLQTFWHSRDPITVSDKTVSWPVGTKTMRVRQVWANSATTVDVLDELALKCSPPPPAPQLMTAAMGCWGGSIHDAQRKWAARFVPADGEGLRFRAAAYAVTMDANAAITAVAGADLLQTTVTRPGKPSVVVLSSLRVGPEIVNTFAPDSLGRIVLTADQTKAETVWQARLLDSLPDLALPAGTNVYALDLAESVTRVRVNGQDQTLSRAGDLVWLVVGSTPPPPPPTVTPAQQLINEIRQRLDALDALVP